MGSGRWSADDWKTYSTTNSYDSKSREEIFTSRHLNADLDPKGIKVRESRDSADNPESTAVILALDVTGSMGMLAEAIARKGLDTLCTEIYSRRPVSDPHVMVMALGDAEMGDKAPLQASQFEADIRIIEQLEKLYLEGGGGGNSYESYALAWYFAATRCKTDCFEKRSKKGYLFTIGDEDPTPYLMGRDIQRVLGDSQVADKIDAAELLTMASREWDIYHVVAAGGAHCRAYGADNVGKKWSNLLGQKVIMLSDHTKLAEVIVSAIQVAEGADHKSVAGSWDGSTALVVGKAISGLAKSYGKGSDGGVVKL